MKEINATLFRLTFIDLTEPVIVIYHGRPILEVKPIPVDQPVSPLRAKTRPVNLTKRA